MATINDKVYMLTHKLPYEGTTRTMLYANRQTAIKNAIKDAKRIEKRDIGETYAITKNSETEFTIVIYDGKIGIIEDENPIDYPSLYITVNEMVIH